MNRSQPLRVLDYLEHIDQAIGRVSEYVNGIDHAHYLWRTVQSGLPGMRQAIRLLLAAQITS